MLETTGVTLITLLALLLGLLALSLVQLIAARRNKTGLRVADYVIVHWPETLLGTVCALVMWLGMPEIAATFPDLARLLGISAQQSILSSFIVGFMSNAVADFLGGRARAIGGGGGA